MEMVSTAWNKFGSHAGHADSSIRLSSAPVRALCAFAVFAAASASCLAQGEPSPRDPYRQAILIGVWEYEKLSTLPTMQANLDALSRTFDDNLNFDKVVPLPNPNRNEIIAALAAAQTRSKQEGESRAVLTVVYFAGHGTMIGHRSLLLAREFTSPSDVSEISRSGSIGFDTIGEALGGQPTLLMVEACRNPFVPVTPIPPADAAPADAATPDAAEAAAMPTPMLNAPEGPTRYAIFFAQKPGALVTLPPRAPTEMTPFVDAVTFALDQGLAKTPASLEAGVKTLVEARIDNRLSPELVSKGEGEIRLDYDTPGRNYDRDEWAKYKNRPDMIRIFLNIYRTSPHVPVARWLLSQQEALTPPQGYVAYTQEVKSDVLGRWKGWRTEATPRTIDSDSVLRSDDGERHYAHEIASVRRNDHEDRDSTYVARNVSGETFTLSRKPLPKSFDPSLVNAFWTDASTQTIACDAPAILSGGCETVEQTIALIRGRDVTQIGTVFVAAVFGSDAGSESIGATSERLLAVENRMKMSGVSDTAIAYRSFYRSDLPLAQGTLLVKRGDGVPLSQE